MKIYFFLFASFFIIAFKVEASQSIGFNHIWYRQRKRSVCAGTLAPCGSHAQTDWH